MASSIPSLFQNTLAVTFHSSTRFLKVGGDIVDEIRLPGFLFKKMTLTLVLVQLALEKHTLEILTGYQTYYYYI